MAHRNDVAPADEDFGLPESDMVVDEKGGAQGNEGGLPIGFQLGPLVRVQGVLDRQLVQAELGLKLAEILFIGGFNADPDEVIGSCRPLAALADRDLGYLAAVAVGSRSDYPAHRASLARNSADHIPVSKTLLVNTWMVNGSPVCGAGEQQWMPGEAGCIYSCLATPVRDMIRGMIWAGPSGDGNNGNTEGCRQMPVHPAASR